MENQFPVTFLFIRTQIEAGTSAPRGGLGCPVPCLFSDTPEQNQAPAHLFRADTRVVWPEASAFQGSTHVTSGNRDAWWASCRLHVFRRHATWSGNLNSQQFPVMDKGRGPWVHLFSTISQLRNIPVHMWTLAISLEGLFAFNTSGKSTQGSWLFWEHSLCTEDRWPPPQSQSLSAISFFSITKRSEWLPTPFWILRAHTLWENQAWVCPHHPGFIF